MHRGTQLELRLLWSKEINDIWNGEKLFDRARGIIESWVIPGRHRATIKLFRRKNEALSMIARPTASKTRRRSKGNNGGPRERAQGRSHVVVIQCFPDLTVRATCATISLCHFSARIRSIFRSRKTRGWTIGDEILWKSRNLYLKWEYL